MKTEYNSAMTNWVRMGFPAHQFVSVYAADETSSESKEIISYEPVEYIGESSDGYDSASSLTADDANSEGEID